MLFDDKRGCQERLKSQLLAEPDDYLKWIDHFTGDLVYHNRFPSVIQGLTIGDIIANTAVWSMPGWFWKTAHAYWRCYRLPSTRPKGGYRLPLSGRIQPFPKPPYPSGHIATLSNSMPIVRSLSPRITDERTMRFHFRITNTIL